MELERRGEVFRELRVRPGIFAIPNPWDAGSAIALARIGFEALATTSAGVACSLGRPDGHRAVSRQETLANAAAIAAVSYADLNRMLSSAPTA